MQQLDDMRARAYEVLRSSWGNKLLPVRLTRGLLTFVNDMAGRPLASKEEIDERRDYERRRRENAAEARAKREAEARAANGAAAKPKREPAPVCVYVDGPQGKADVRRIGDILRGRDIPFTQLDIENDEATRSWVLTTARTRELPVVFVAGQPVGDVHQLMQLDADGGLVKLVFG